MSESAPVHLVAQWRGPEGPRLESIRILTPDEASAATVDAALIHRLLQTVGWGAVAEAWSTLQALLRGVNEATGHADARRRLEAETEISASCEVLLAAAHRLALEVRAESERALVDSAARSAHEARLDRVGWRPVAEALEAFRPSARRELLVSIESGLEVSPGRRASAVALAKPCVDALRLRSLDGSRYLAEPVLGRLVGLCEIAYASLLTATFPLYEAAALRLRRMSSDMLFGEPVLIAGLEGSLPGSPRNLEITRLNVDLIPSLLLAAKQAEQVIRDVDDPGRPSATGAPTIARASHDPGADQPTLPGSAAGDAGIEEDRPTEAGGGSKEGVQFSEPIDIGGFVAELQGLSNKIERRWSESLAYALKDEEIAAEVSRWQCLLQTFMRETERRGQSARAKGAERIIEKWPLGPAEAARLETHAIGEAALAQEEVALLYAIKELADATGALSEPSTFEHDLMTRETTSWWDSGAFVHARDAANLALRTWYSVKSAEAGAGGTPSRGGPPAGWTWLQSAHRALAAGLPEAALMYGVLAVNAPPFITAEGNRSKERAGTVLGELGELASRGVDALFAGEPVSPGFVVPMAYVLVEELQEAMRRSATRWTAS